MADDQQHRNSTKSWESVDGKLPSDLKELLRAKIYSSSQIVYPDPMVAPWLQFPEYARSSMGWRMGGGEDYMFAFRTWFKALDRAAQRNYQHENEEPKGWNGFYDSFKL
ncbi:hypothetical protein [Celeribacter baekdonensis]|jgi:hypothetical protein|uniref:Uncharacterized protein n=1 Tax=Celeribacter baekdonensis TaxID=875171 RepID=A0A2R4M072_9RHOB|nr:hypothetical protein [Celeribacter baekdonensis]AVW90573.1 hypothetical protein DA792_05290 [Celeribacter baekdonensis]